MTIRSGACHGARTLHPARLPHAGLTCPGLDRQQCEVAAVKSGPNVPLSVMCITLLGMGRFKRVKLSQSKPKAT